MCEAREITVTEDTICDLRERIEKIEKTVESLAVLAEKTKVLSNLLSAFPWAGPIEPTAEQDGE